MYLTYVRWPGLVINCIYWSRLATSSWIFKEQLIGCFQFYSGRWLPEGLLRSLNQIAGFTLVINQTDCQPSTGSNLRILYCRYPFVVWIQRNSLVCKYRNPRLLLFEFLWLSAAMYPASRPAVNEHCRKTLRQLHMYSQTWLLRKTWYVVAKLPRWF